MDGVKLTKLKKIHNAKGDIMHAMKKSDSGYYGFGEAYFSTIKEGVIKGWKKHLQMTLNIVVPIGEIKFVIFDENFDENISVSLSENNYLRLTVRPGLWVAFKGEERNNMLLNLASIEHDPDESINKDLSEIKYEW